MNKITIQPESCKSCGFCIKFCPNNVLAVGNHVNGKGYEYVVAEHQERCISCRLCAIICPDAAIEVYR